MARSLNKVQLIGNLTRDPELRQTPSGSDVCTFGLATNRSWKTESGEQKEEVDFHRIVAWTKLATLCNQFLQKGRKVYVSGRISTRKYTDKTGADKETTEVIIDEMILLDSQGSTKPAESVPMARPPVSMAAPSKVTKTAAPDPAQQEAEVSPDEIPF